MRKLKYWARITIPKDLPKSTYSSLLNKLNGALFPIHMTLGEKKGRVMYGIKVPNIHMIVMVPQSYCEVFKSPVESKWRKLPKLLEIVIEKNISMPIAVQYKAMSDKIYETDLVFIDNEYVIVSPIMHENKKVKDEVKFMMNTDVLFRLNEDGV